MTKEQVDCYNCNADKRECAEFTREHGRTLCQGRTTEGRGFLEDWREGLVLQSLDRARGEE